MKILFHVDENCKWKTILENVSNVIKSCNETKETFSIEVAANGDAVITLKEQAVANLKMITELTELSKEGVVFAACRNALNKFAISEEVLLPFVQVVPAGVIEIVKRQEEGYSYIKP